ncbi:CBS domain-containing protein [Streptomyces sp. NPDC088732]|uniref:CBS domain-containing protein n=1 Tax=Streptomyces sp. NPDC088732 TaxID=3365879 RepID=UPI003825205D
MWHRSVSDLMTAPAVSVRADAPFKEIAKLLAEHDVTALPVVDDGSRPVGVVSEADLLRKEAGQRDPADLMPPPYASSADRAKAEAVSAVELMTSPAVTARPEWTVVEAARTMEQHRVKRLPVVDEVGCLVGVLSRSDLLRVFLRQDRAIRDEITSEVLGRTLRLSPLAVTVHVVDGRVSLEGTIERRSVVPVLVALCNGVDGVVDVREHLRYRADDSSSPAPAHHQPA